jgi:hypothetical protein
VFVHVESHELHDVEAQYKAAANAGIVPPTPTSGASVNGTATDLKSAWGFEKDQEMSEKGRKP